MNGLRVRCWELLGVLLRHEFHCPARSTFEYDGRVAPVACMASRGVRHHHHQAVVNLCPDCAAVICVDDRLGDWHADGWHADGCPASRLPDVNPYTGLARYILATFVRWVSDEPAEVADLSTDGPITR